MSRILHAIRLLVMVSQALLWSSCVTVSEAPNRAPLPDGTYLHQVDFWMERSGDQRFKGVLKVKDRQIHLVILSPFDTTLVRIRDRLSADDPQIEVNTPELQTQRDRIREAYLGLKPALVDLQAPTVTIFNRTATVERQNIDSSGVPGLIKITDEHFRFAIEVSRP